MKRKFISMICALSMIFSVVGGFSMISAQADGEQTLTSSAVNNGDGTATLTFTASGFTSNVKLFQFAAKVDSTVFDTSSIDIDTELNSAISKTWSIAAGYQDGMLMVSAYAKKVDYAVDMSSAYDAVSVTLPIKNVADTEITMLDSWSDQVVLVKDVNDDVFAKDGYSDTSKSITLVSGSLATPTEAPATTAPDVTVTPATVAPTTEATVGPTARPTINPDARPTKIPTEAPATEAPTVEPTPEASTYPQKLTSSAKVENGEATITFTASGFTSNVKLFQFAAKVDSSIVDTSSADILTELNSDISKTWSIAAGYQDGMLMVSAYAKKVDYAVDMSGAYDIVTVTLPVIATGEFTSEITMLDSWSDQVVLVKDVNDDVFAKDGYSDTSKPISLVSGTLTNVTPATPAPAEPTAEPTAAPTVKPDSNSVTVKEVVGSGNVSDIDTAKKTDDIGLNIVFKNADGVKVPAEYGDDFVVADKDGNILTYDEYTNMINGYSTDTLAKLINEGGKFYIYNDSIETISADVIDYTTNDYIGDSTTVTTVKPESTTEPSSKVYVKWDKPSSVKADSSFKVKATFYSDAKYKNELTDGTVTYEITSGDKYVEDADGDLTSKGYQSYETTSKAAGKTIKIQATYDDGNGTTATDTISIKVKSDSDDDSSSGGSSSGSGKGGSIYTGTTGTTTNTTTGTTGFTDLYNVESWAGDAIRGLAAKGVVNGRTSTEFDPEANVTRAEFTKMLVGALGISTSGAPDPGFEDVASDGWAYGYIAAAKYLGLVTGRTDTVFDPDAQISRQEAAAMIYRASTTTNKTLTAVNAAVDFTDQADISDYAVTSVSTLQQAGIINGFEDSTFRPNDNATRAQAAVMLWKYINL